MIRLNRQSAIPAMALLILLSSLAGCTGLYRPFGPPLKIAVGKLTAHLGSAEISGDAEARINAALLNYLQERDLLWTGQTASPVILTGEMRAIREANPLFTQAADVWTFMLAGKVREGDQVLKQTFASVRADTETLDPRSAASLAQELIDRLVPPAAATDTYDGACYGACGGQTGETTTPIVHGGESPTSRSRTPSTPVAVGRTAPRTHSDVSVKRPHEPRPASNPVESSIPRSHPARAAEPAKPGSSSTHAVSTPPSSFGGDSSHHRRK